MPQRIAFLFNCPLADSTGWRRHLDRAGHGRYPMLVVFGKAHWIR